MLPPNEEVRLLQLRSLKIIDTLPEQSFDTLVQGVADLLDVPVVLVSLIDEHRQWFKARVGLDVCETSRDVAFCAHAILHDEPLIVPNATLDDRFFDNPLVVGDMHLRFYAGAPIVVEGQRLGTLCCLDFVPRTFSHCQIRGLVAMAKQVSILLETRQLTEQLCESEALFSSALHAMQNGLVVQDENGKILSANRRASEILRLSREQLKGRASIDPSWQAIHEDGSEWPGIDHPPMVAMREGIAQNGRVMGVHDCDDNLTWIRINANPLFKIESPEPYGVVVTFSDITEERADKDQIVRQLELIKAHSERLTLENSQVVRSNMLLHDLSMTDHLTGISNTRAFKERLEDEIALCERKQTQCSILMIDVDHFKSVNDEFGHIVGDQVLRQIADCLKEATRKGEFLARYGGEEFIVLLPDASREEAIRAGERLRKFVEAGEWTHRPITASFGVATWSAGTSPSDLLNASDEALYRSKDLGRNRVTHADQIAPKPLGLHIAS